jgi:hypothetical protein
MTPAELLADLGARGFGLWHHGPKLHVAPRSLLDADDRAALIEHKPALLALLADVSALERDRTATKLRTIAATLGPVPFVLLRAEAAAGDRLAELVTAVLATPREGVVVLRCTCGGVEWHPEPHGKGERCVECGVWSPVSVVDGAEPGRG